MTCRLIIVIDTTPPPPPPIWRVHTCLGATDAALVCKQNTREPDVKWCHVSTSDNRIKRAEPGIGQFCVKQLSSCESLVAVRLPWLFEKLNKHPSIIYTAMLWGSWGGGGAAADPSWPSTDREHSAGPTHRDKQRFTLTFRSTVRLLSHV